MTGVDVPPESQSADRADQCGEGERPTIGEKALAKRNEQRDLPHEHITRRNPPIGHKQQYAGYRSSERARYVRFTLTSGAQRIGRAASAAMTDVVPNATRGPKVTSIQPVGRGQPLHR